MYISRKKIFFPVVWLLWALLWVGFLSATSANGQDNLYLVDDDTEVAKISFAFPEGQSFTEATLLQQISHSQPGFRDRYFVWRDEEYSFSPVDLQKDVVRLRRFYNRNGFLHPTISYEESSLDTDGNKIHIRFSIIEGPPVIIQDFGFYSVDGDYAVYLFEGATADKWADFESNTAIELGRRYTQFAEATIETQVLAWLRNSGYAFSDLDLATVIDSTYNTADVRFVVQPGPLAKVDNIEIEGNVAVGDRVVTRELPFKVGDTYSGKRVVRGQQELLSMNLFRLVLSDLPEQQHDSTVTVRYRLREVDLRKIGVQTGYSRASGPAIEASWQHRNFFGGARNFSVGLTAETGFKAARSGNNIPPQIYGATTTLRQPYFFSRKVSASVSPFVRFEKDTRIQQAEVFKRQYGLSTNLIYEFHSYRTSSLTYTLSKNKLPGGLALGTDDDLYSKSILSVTSTIGKTDNYLNPRRGWLFRPFLETAGAIVSADIQYVKGSAQLLGYIPITRSSEVISRVFAGTVLPFGDSSAGLDGSNGAADSLVFENRFDDVLFYAGGSTSVRGWPDQLLGTKIARELFDSDGEPLSPRRFAYEPIGGRSKIEASLSYRFPFPGLGPKWKLATFLDAGLISSTIDASSGGISIGDDGILQLDNILYASGAGIRYQTLFGFVRIDVAAKLNPTDADLISAEDLLNGIDNPRQIRRFRLHVSIGQTF